MDQTYSMFKQFEIIDKGIDAELCRSNKKSKIVVYQTLRFTGS